MEDSPKIILSYASNEFEIPLPNDYNELLNIFVNKFKLDENLQKKLKLTYNDGEDDVWLDQEEGYNIFKDQIKENSINNEIKGVISRESRVSIDNKDFLQQLDNVQKTLSTIQDPNISLDKKISLEKSNGFGDSINVDLDKDDTVKTINPVQNFLYSYNDNDNDNEKKKEDKNSEIKILKEEKEKQEKKLVEYEQKYNEQEEHYKTKLEMQEKNYRDKIDKLESDLKQLTEEKEEKKLKLEEYEKKSKEQEKKYRDDLEQHKLNYKNQIDKINSEIKKLKEEKNQKEIELDEYTKKVLEQEKNYQTKLKLEENKYNLKVDEFNNEIKKVNDEKEKISLKLEDYEKRIEEFKKNNDNKNIKILEEKIKKLENDEKEYIKAKNEILKKNRELIKNLQTKENIIKEYELKIKDNEEKSFNSILEYKEKNNKMEKEIHDYKKKLENLSKKEEDIKQIENKANQLLNENRKDKAIIAELQKQIEKNNTDDNNHNQNNNISYIDNNTFDEKSKLIQKCLEEQSKEYKSELDKIRNEFKDKLNNQCKDEIKDKYNYLIYNKIYNEVNNQSEILLKNYLEQLEKFENKRRNDFTQIINGNKIFLDVNETIHDGIKCNNCSQKPIIGERYQCSKCKNYNLCKKCEEENSTNLKHKHNFIKIRYIINDENNNIIEKENHNKDSDDKNNEIIKIEKDDNKKVIKYSFKIEDKKDVYLLYSGTKFYEIELTIINDSNFEYPEGAKIKYNEQSNIKPIEPEIIINKLKPNEAQKITIKYQNLKYYEPNDNPYNSIYNLEINGETFGNEIVILMKFLDNNNFKLVEQFRKVVKDSNIGILEKYKNEDIINFLKKNKCNFDWTLDKILREANRKTKK